MIIEKYVLGPLQTNTYLLQEKDKVLLIDPASKAEKLIEILNDRKLVGMLLTHGHFDHIKAVDGLYDKYQCPIYIHHDDLELAKDKTAGQLFNLVSYISSPTIDLVEGKMNIDDFSFEVVFSPGHTEGSVLYVFDDCIFTGDTLFKGSIGRSDLKGGNYSKLKNSLNYFKQLNQDYVIYPGHDESTTLSEELLNNYYLQ